MIDTRSCPRLALVVPCYNEAEIIADAHETLANLLGELVRGGRIAESSRIYYVDDGSGDSTWSLLQGIAREAENAVAIRLSNNFGHQSALLAGLFATDEDITISLDADLQDDIGVVADMIDAYMSGSDIVYGVRTDRDTDRAFKRLTAKLYYRLLRVLGVDIVADHADFRLMSRRAIEALKCYSEVNVFLRGLVPHLGFASAKVYYQRKARSGGTAKYDLARMLSLALEGVTSFSSVPLRLIAAVGVLVFLVSSGMGVYTLVLALFSDATVPGWASTVLPIYFLGGIQIIFLGVVGEYLGKMYLETKRRPRYVIQEIEGRTADGQVATQRSAPPGTE